MPQTSYHGPGSSDSLRYTSATNSSESPDPYESRNHQRHVYSTSPPPIYQPERQSFNITSAASAAAMDSLQRRPSYPERYEYHHQDHNHDHDQSSSSSEPGIHTYGHQRSHSFHGYQLPSSEVHPLGPGYYSYSQQPTLGHVQDPNSSNRIQQHVPPSTLLTGRSSRENDYGHESSFQSRQRSASTSTGNPLSSLQPHSPRSPPNSRSPQTPPLTPSPQKYSQSLSQTPQQLQQRQHHSLQHSQHHPRVATTASTHTGKVTHKASGAAVGSNRRLAHILSEQKRREKINGGFDELKSVIPECSQNTDSKATILRKATAYILALEDELRRYTGPYHQTPTHPGPYQEERDHDQGRE